ncbi:hypothetical protein JOQ06_013553 [Pogonophryne albipinna]|uniref:E3 ubiquitin-protein ligase Topors n=1 Tax=Pogonophryne albipinna TaxID=1090488 RepID=A0AAD6BJX9_9TELE|nr:hypothetical protein JOQ06_013553 [Pogonophryne albipinna]
MAPTRMKLRVRIRDNNTAASTTGSTEPVEEEERSRGVRSSSRRKKKSTPNTPTASSSSPPLPPLPLASSSSSSSLPVPEEASPDSKCPICLDRFNNLAYLDRCLHRFCFPCIQEWSHSKAECPLCKQPFTSILHSVLAEDDFKEYTLRPPTPASSSVAATVAMVAAMASAARNDHQMRLMLRRQRREEEEVGVGGEAVRRRRRRGDRERGGRGGRGGVWEWYINSRPVRMEENEEEEESEEQRRDVDEALDRGVIFEGLSGLVPPGDPPVAPGDRASRRLTSRLVSRRRLQRDGGAVRRLRDRETVAFRRSLYRLGVRVHGVAGVSAELLPRDITADSFRLSPAPLERLRPWLRRELTVLYGVHTSLVDIVQRIVTARLQRHGLEDQNTIEEELRPFLLARTNHFLHEMVSFASSPLALESYDLEAVYEPPDDAIVQLNDDSSDGRRREDRSPSVEIIYEGTIPPNAAHPPARKRRRKRQRKTQHSSSPVIITLDNLPPLPLVHPSGVGGALSGEIGDLPVDILDPIAINSDIDVENFEVGGSSLDEEPIRTSDLSDDAEVTNSSLKRKSISDSRLLARILNDLQGINTAKLNPLNFEPRDSRRNRFLRDDNIDHRDFDPPTYRNATHPLTYFERLKEKEVPPLLKQASPVRTYNRNTPPPLKHKDAGSPHLSPISPIDLHSNPTIDVSQGNRAIPPISTLKQHFTSALALRGELASTSSAIDSHSSKDEEGRGADYIPSYGESLFHVLTCLERYLAVVRPIIYLRLRNVQGVRIRNISIGLSVLCVLIRPGPGDGERVDQSKQSAFYTVTAITAALWLWLLGPRITKALCGVPLFTVRTCCAMMSSLVSYNVPCSLTSPLLFLHTDTIVVLL